MAGDLKRSSDRDGGGDRLDGREREVLAASARGASLREVAEELALAEDEVRAALASAMRKLGARSKLEALLIALRQGLLK